MRFTKMQGCGNDYVYVNGFTEKLSPEEKPEIVRSLSDRHFGIGGDGVIFINPAEEADFEMEMYNADGSQGKMCGNGIRCVGKYVYDNKMTDKTTITVETLSGIKNIAETIKETKNSLKDVMFTKAAKKIYITCPKCGAQIEGVKKQVAVCEYCGNRMAL